MWIDLRISLGSFRVDSSWFANGISYKLGNGSSLNFWRHKWLRSSPLRDQISNLFSYVQSSRSKVMNLGNWTNGIWNWSVVFNQDMLQISTRTDWANLHHNLININLVHKSPNKFVWWCDLAGFSVKSIFF